MHITYGSQIFQPDNKTHEMEYIQLPFTSPACYSCVKAVDIHGPKGETRRRPIWFSAFDFQLYFKSSKGGVLNFYLPPSQKRPKTDKNQFFSFSRHWRNGPCMSRSLW